MYPSDRLVPALALTVARLAHQLADISAERKERLSGLVDAIVARRQAGRPVRLHFICTHNSRRSQLAQVWAAVAAFEFGALDVEVYSGGTEVTAFHPHAVAALTRAGVSVVLDPPPATSEPSEAGNQDNPKYQVYFTPSAPTLLCYSKLYDAAENPTQDFVAVMTCAAADATCPAIPGAERVALPYDDPKVADGTPQAAAAYDACSEQIATELLWVFREVATRLAP